MYFVLTLLWLILLIPAGFAAPFFDSNCQNVLPISTFVKGSLELNQKSERVIYHDKVYEAYRSLITDISKSIPGNANCYGETNLNSCVGFKAYCLENFASQALVDDLDKWSSINEDCLKKNTCKKIDEKNSEAQNLEYIKNMALKFSQVQERKNAQAQTFTSQALTEFSPLANNLVLLKKRKADEKAALDKLLATKKVLEQCQGVVMNDDNDINNRQISGNLAEQLTGSCPYIPFAALDTSGATKLGLELDKIKTWSLTEATLTGIQEEALEKTVKGIWASYEQNFGANIDRVTLICNKAASLCSDPKIKAKINTIAKNFSKTKIPFLSLEERKTIVENDFNQTVGDLNKVCNETKQKYLALQNKYSCAPVFDLTGKTKPRVMTESLCKSLKDSEYYEAKTLEGQTRLKVETYRDQLLSSKFGPLMITPNYQTNVGSFDSDDTYQKCMKGKGTFLNKTDLNNTSLALTQFYDLNVKELRDLEKEINKNKIPSNVYAKNTIIKEYLKDHPLTVVDYLAKNPEPELAKTLCRIIREINSSEQNRHYLKMGVAGIGFVSSLALSMTGVGAPAGMLLATLTGGSISAQVILGVQDYSAAGESIKRNTQAAATGQQELLTALQNIDQLTEQKESELENLIILVGTEVTGVAATQVVKYLSKADNFVRIANILRGAKNAKKVIYVDDLKTIQTSLKNLQQTAKQVGLSPKVFDGLYPSELAELSLRFKNMPSEKVKEILSAMKKARGGGHGYARALLTEVRNEVVDLSRFQKTLDNMANLKLPNGTNLGTYLSRIEKMTRVQSQPEAFLRLIGNWTGKKLIYFFNWLKNDYIGEILWPTKPIAGLKIRGLRLFIQNRNQNQSRNFFRDINGYMFNPIATYRNSSWEVTTPVSIIGFTYLFDKPIEYFTKKGLDERLSRNIEEKDRIAGGNYLTGYLQAGVIEAKTYSEIMEKHDTEFENWLASESSTNLSRLNELAGVLRLSVEEIQNVSKLAKKVFNDEYLLYKKYKDQGPDYKGLIADAQALEAKDPRTPEEQMLFEKLATYIENPPGSPKGMENFNNLIVISLFGRIQKDENFKRLDINQQDALATLYFPVIPVGNRTDVALIEALTRDEKFKPINNLRGSGSLTIEHAVYMINSQMDNPGLVAEKLAKVKTLPAELHYLGERMDLPIFSEEINYKNSQGQTIQVKDELDRWKVLSTDSRFKFLYDQFKQNAIGEIEVISLITQEAVNNVTNFYFQMDTHTKSATLTSAQVDLALSSPLLSQQKEMIDQQATNMNWDVTTLNAKKSQLVQFWYDYYSKASQPSNTQIKPEDYWSATYQILGIQIASTESP